MMQYIGELEEKAGMRDYYSNQRKIDMENI